MTLKLHVFPPSPRAFKTLLVANHLGLDYEMRVLNFAAGEHRTAEFTALNVNQRMPVLEDGSYVLWESNAILEYLAFKKPEAGLLPADTPARLNITKWLYWDCAHWDPAVAIFMFERVVKKLFNRGETDEKEIARGTEMIGRLARVLDGELARHRYVAGDRITLPDLCLSAAFLHEAARLPLDEYRGIQRWAADIKSLPAWSRAAKVSLG
ncbi:MAG TPA: glutathione S-transferase family protein [Rhizomicrobium sp.]|nr:glutathione S-transferase family protein [Rhizomicrobium sp.]